MSMTTLRGYFRSQLTGLKYKEWTDGFNSDNIPDTNLNLCFHLEAPKQSRVQMNNTGINFTVSQTVLIFFEGYISTAKAIDTAVLAQETIMKTLLLPSNRLVQTFKNLDFKGAQISKINRNNNTSAKLSMDFEADIYLDI